MDLKTERLMCCLDEMAVNIDNIQSFLRSGDHDLTPDEVEEWIEAINRHSTVYKSMILILMPKPIWSN
jgi:hypothetical protein